MIRTTDTGGVKLLYNGEVENNQCVDSKGYHPKYNKLTANILDTNYFYGTSYNYNKTTKLFTLDGEITTGEIKSNQYTCLSNNRNATCQNIYIVSNKYPTTENKYYLITISSKENITSAGSLLFNGNYESLAGAGYMKSMADYSKKEKDLSERENVLQQNPINLEHWYSNSYNYENNHYKLTNPFQINNKNDYNNIIGKYTLLSNNSDYESLYINYISGADNSKIYYIQNNMNNTYTYGNSYINNGDGTYTINNPTTFDSKNYYNNYNNIINKYVCKNATNNICNEVWYTLTSTKTYFTYLKVDYNYKYSKGFTYKIDESDGKYKYFLNDSESVSFWNVFDDNNVQQIKNAHYTCWNSTGKCETISYVYIFDLTAWGKNQIYIDIENGKSVEDAINEMLYNDDVNQNDTYIKQAVDDWYSKYMLEYADYTEDTIFCNNRTIKNLQTTGFNPNGGDLTFKETRFNNDDTTDLSCTNETDKFSTENDKAKLKYKVGLISYPEVQLINNRKIYEGKGNFWTMTPRYFMGTTSVIFVGNNESIGNNSTGNPSNYDSGIRPAISLKPGSFYTTGNGSKETPYIVYTE